MSTNVTSTAASKQATASGTNPPSSVWSKGPPAGASNPSSTQASGVATPASSSSPQLNGSSGNGAVAAAGGHSRKGTMMVGGSMDIKKGSIAFGTVDSPNPLLSSSPAAPSITGTHLADTVKSFGSLAADSPDPDSVKAPSRRTSTLASPDPSNGVLDKKKGPEAAPFYGKPGAQPNGQSFMPMRPQANMPQSRSPQQVNQAMPPFTQQGASQVQHGFRPPQPGMMPQMQPGMPRMMRPPQYAMPAQGYPMMYPQQGHFYPGYADPAQYGMKPQWAPPQHPQAQANYGLSPRPAAAQPLPSPGTTAPSSAGPSPGQTPAIRPPSLGSQGQSPALGHAPSTPARSSVLQPGATFTPGSQPSFTPGRTALNAGSSTFTPAASKAVKISRPDGTAFDLKSIAAAAKGSSTSSSPAPEPKPEPTPAPKKKVHALPTIVRMESEEQREKRLKEDAQKEQIRKLEEQEERERKERKERQAREDEEKKQREAKEAEEKVAKEAAEAEEKRKQEALAAEEAAKNAEQRKATEEEEEERKKAADTPETSAVATPADSPAQRNASLPPKPASHRPPALDLKSSAKAGPSALHTAKPIEDLKAITYPGSYHPPSAALNANSPPGQYRYDLDFLLQFMSLCRDKPEGFPALADVGMAPDASGGAGGAGRGGRGGRGGMGPPGRGGAAIGGMGRPPMGQGMGSFGMGNFGSGSIRGTTSEERIQMSNARAAMGRTPSQGGPSGLPPMMTSRSGNRSGRGTRRPAQAPVFNDPNVAPLAISANSWVKARPTDTDEKSPAFIERKVKALLNKLTEEKFESISNQILEWANKSRDETDGMTLKLVIKQIFEKATDEAHWSSMYAKLCRKLLDCLDPAVTEELDGKPTSGGTLFRKYLVGRCQMDFEAGWKAREDAASAAKAKSDEDKAKQEQHDKDKADGKETEEVVMLSDEYYAAQKAKRRGLGLVQLIGELYKLDMINNRVIKSCLKKLMINITDPDEEDLESTCRLITTVGKQLEARAPEDIDIVWSRLDLILALDTLPSRIRFMIMDVKDLRKNHWVSRNKQAGVMTIAEIHQQAAREQAEKTAAVQRESLSRGGSRAGHARRDGPQPGEWQSVATNARPLQRPADFSNLGRNFSSAGLPREPNFGPASVFQNKRKNQAGGATPPLSRQASTANMFGVLSGDGVDAAAPAAEEAAPQRKKLQLKPRTKPIKGEGEEAEEGEVEDGEDDEEEAEDEDEEDDEEDATAAAASMTETAAKAKIDTDMKELWGEKDAGGSRNVDDIVEYFKSLPDERKSLLSERLADDVFRIAKLRDAELVARGWSAALEQGAASKEVLQKGIEIHMPTLDDDAIDFPQAYKAIALLMRSLSLGEDEIKSLLEKVDVYGTPRITPTDKLNKAFTQLDEEAKA